MHYVLSACVVARKLSGIELAAAVESLQARAGAAHLGAHWRLLPSAAEAAHTGSHQRDRSPVRTTPSTDAGGTAGRTAAHVRHRRHHLAATSRAGVGICISTRTQ